MGELLDRISAPGDLRRLSMGQLRRLAGEIREVIIEAVSRNGGHLASNLGVVELTIALHYCFDFLRDCLVWDVGHQAYAHKILTGRREAMRRLRRKGGASGFADKRESPYDHFSFGHTGTSLSAGLGVACARAALGAGGKVVAVIGDGAIASGMPFEALNNAADLGKNLIIILNDNKMSISPSIGAVAKHLSRIRSSAPYMGIKRELTDLLSRWRPALEAAQELYGRLSEGLQAALTPGGLFVELGLRYYGPINGHELPELIDALEHMKRIPGPVLLHVLTEKGRGFEPARTDPVRFHSSGRFAWGAKPSSQPEEVPAPDGQGQNGDRARRPTYSQTMGNALLSLAGGEPRLVAITAAMRDGTGLGEFAGRYPDRFYDVGICEQHAVGFAGGLAAGGMKPVVCIYSTFLQRAFDQLFHDVALQSAPVVFCVDRAGLVGSDGPTHHGLYDIAYFRGLPGFVVMAPADGEELERMLSFAVACGRPCAIRYPREAAPPALGGGDEIVPGRAQVLRQGQDGAIIAYGAMVARALDAADILGGRGHDVTGRRNHRLRRHGGARPRCGRHPRRPRPRRDRGQRPVRQTSGRRAHRARRARAPRRAGGRGPFAGRGIRGRRDGTARLRGTQRRSRAAGGSAGQARRSRHARGAALGAPSRRARPGRQAGRADAGPGRGRPERPVKKRPPARPGVEALLCGAYTIRRLLKGRAPVCGEKW